MKKNLNSRFLLVAVLMSAAISIYGQGPLKQRVDFSINTPFALRMGDYMLPPGNYVLHRVLDNDPNLFSLHPGDLSHEPIAMIRTARIDYAAGRYPEHTKLFVEMDEASSDNHPVLEGWTIPGMDGWEVIGVVEKKTGVLTKVNSSQLASSGKHKLDKSKINFAEYGKNDKRSRIEFKTYNK
jgi:hypothetical protein